MASVEVSVGTFNLNNLFGRWNLYVDVAEPLAVAAAAEAGTAGPVPRSWLRAPTPPDGPAAGLGLAAGATPDVRITIDGKLLPDGSVRWRTSPSGSVVYQKPVSARTTLAGRIAAMDVDVLAVQEVEDLPALEQFMRSDAMAPAKFRHAVLVEGNDDRLIDVGVLSRLPIGRVTSHRNRTYQNGTGGPIFSRDLLEVEILSKTRDHVLFTAFVNHLKSQLARNEKERLAGELRRTRQAETIAAILAARPAGPVVVLGDMNDAPGAATLQAVAGSGLVNALTAPTETGGPYPASDPDQPTTTAWTHRYKASGQPAAYELFDQIWLSPDLEATRSGAWIGRRTSRAGDASDHDPAWVRFSA